MNDLARQMARGWPALIVSMILGLLLGIAAGALRPASYYGESNVYISLPADQSPKEQLADSGLLAQYALSYAELAASQAIAGGPLNANGYTASASSLALAKTLEIRAVGPGLVVIGMKAGSPSAAGAISGGIADNLAAAVNDGSLKLLGAQTVATVGGPPVVVATTNLGGTTLMLILGLLIGLVFGLAGLAVWASITRRVMSTAGLRTVLPETDVIGSLRSSSSEDARAANTAVAVRLSNERPEGRGKLILLTTLSSTSKPASAAEALATGLTMMGLSVAVLPPDASGAPSAGRQRADDSSAPNTPVDGLPAVASLPSTADLSTEGGSEQMVGLLESCDVVVCELPMGDSGRLALIAQQYADAVVLAVPAGKAPAATVQEAFRQVSGWSAPRPQAVLLTK